MENAMDNKKVEPKKTEEIATVVLKAKSGLKAGLARITRNHSCW
jgi:hypothetical protein